MSLPTSRNRASRKSAWCEWTLVLNHSDSASHPFYLKSGFCYGGRICGQASIETKDLGAAVGIHPSFLTVADGEAIKNPFACLPAMDDPDFTEFVAALERNDKLVPLLSRRKLLDRGVLTLPLSQDPQTTRRPASPLRHRTTRLLHSQG